MTLVQEQNEEAFKIEDNVIRYLMPIDWTVWTDPVYVTVRHAYNSGRGTYAFSAGWQKASEKPVEEPGGCACPAGKNLTIQDAAGDILVGLLMLVALGILGRGWTGRL